MPKNQKTDRIDGYGDRLEQLQTFSKTQLLRLWLELFRRPAAPRVRRELMVPILAYRLQEEELGGLPARERNRLRALSDGDGTKGASRSIQGSQIKPGTQLIREWQGETHRVVVAGRGFEYAGQTHSSLSQIARLITGTRWSGPLFFGLRQAPSRRDEN